MTHESTERNILSVHNEFILFKVEADNFLVPLAFQSGIIVGTAFFFFCKDNQIAFPDCFPFLQLSHSYQQHRTSCGFIQSLGCIMETEVRAERGGAKLPARLDHRWEPM